MASGSFGNGSGQNCRLGINWSSSKGNSGSTVNATLIAQNQNNWYFSAYVYGGYGITINGNQKTGSGAQLSGSVNGSVGLISHSVWVAYTGDKTITISGYANFNGIINLSNQTISGNVKLDNVGTAPSMGSVTAPTSNYVASETITSLSVSWNAGSSYNNSGTYRVDVSINGGNWEWVSGDLGWDRRSYTYSLPNRSQGTTYQFRVCCGNNIGWSGHVYSAIVSLNYLNAPSIDSMPNPFNPYSSTSFTVGLSGGSQTNGGSFMRRADIYMYNTAGNQVKWYCGYPSYGNTSITVGVSQADVINALGTGRYSAKIYAIAWIENSNGSRSGYVTKKSTVNINTDGGATPTLGAPTISGGAFGYPSTCFASGISTVKVASASAGLRRAPSGTSISYKISCTGVNTQNSSSASFSNLSAGLKTITVTATDSRGLSTSVEQQIRIQPYNVPTIRNYSALRLDNPQTSAKLTYTLAYSEIYAYDKGVDAKGTQLNNINLQQYSTNSTEWNNSSNGITVTGLSTESVYTIYLRIADKLRTKIYTTEFYKVPTIKTNVAIRKHGIGINCVPQTSYALEVNGSGCVSNDLSINGNTIMSGSLDASNMLQVNSNGVAIGKASEKSAFEVNMDTYLLKNIYPTGQISRSAIGSSWIAARDKALIYSRWSESVGTASINSALEIGTPKASWNIGTINESLYLSRTTDIDKQNGNNKPSGKYEFPADGSWSTILLRAFPVGAVYITYNNNNPGNFLGGTWVQFGQGQTLVGQGRFTDKNKTTYTFAEGETGGEYKHKLTVAEMPSHGHKLYARGGQTAQTSSPFADNKPITQGSNSYGFNVSSTGGDGYHNNLSPYITVYFWRRTA